MFETYRKTRTKCSCFGQQCAASCCKCTLHLWMVLIMLMQLVFLLTFASDCYIILPHQSNCFAESLSKGFRNWFHCWLYSSYMNFCCCCFHYCHCGRNMLLGLLQFLQMWNAWLQLHIFIFGNNSFLTITLQGTNWAIEIHCNSILGICVESWLENIWKKGKIPSSLNHNFATFSCPVYFDL